MTASLPEFRHLGHDILLVEGLLEAALCQHLLQVVETCQFETAGIELTQIDTRIRSNDLLRLDASRPLLNSTNRLLLGKVAQIQRLLLQLYGVPFPHAETCSILRYSPGQFYKRHIDNLLLASRIEEASQGIPIRDISIVGYLNQDFAGGETYFDRQELKVKPQAGSVLVFPSYYTHPHQSLPVVTGQKYAFTTWLFH